MAIKAPWKGWLRVAMPIVSFLILANTLAIFVLALFNAATLDLYPDRPAPGYLATHGVLVRAQLVLFWCVVPFVYLIVAGTEHICLWTNHSSPIWIVVSSIVAIGFWILQLVLWSLCIGSDEIPGYCPWVYREPWGEYPSWSVASPQGAQCAVPTIFVLYIVQIGFVASVVHRQRRTCFRKSDLRQSWAGRLEEEESRSRLSGSSVDTPFLVLDNSPTRYGNPRPPRTEESRSRGVSESSSLWTQGMREVSLSEV